MRRPSALYLLFLKQQEQLGVVRQREGNIADMFIRANFTHLEQAVIEYTTKGFGNSTDDLKHGLKTAVYYLIKKACKLIKGMYLIDDEDDKASDVDKFIDVFELSHDYLFGDATYAMNRNRNEKLRKPEALPLEEDIAKFREYTLFRMQAITRESYVVFDTHNFVELRDLLVSRLTLFNARRGGEPCRLRLVEWEDAAKNAWISQQEVQKLDELDRALLKDLKVAYQTGAAKTLHHGQTHHGTTLPVSVVTDLPCTSEMDNEEVTMVSPSVSSSSSASDGEIPLPQQQRKYVQWKTHEEEEVKKHFKQYIEGKAKRRLPSRQELDEFLSHSQAIDFDWKTVKKKVMNEAAKAANIARKRERQMGISEV
ncbi:hypothetical protein HOLleu_03277 [Holothuria leucospilota]|uniref:Uncharacterized protein n=1 Tax=Holothuria leucospilota TaxID=206669 RepID=A0A9Q1CTG1_HOLLE|nr:hypothetical protein HOLleu_03277 [Holothuria leucospilota]